MSPVTQSTYIFRQFIKPLKKKILTLVIGSTGTPYVFFLQRKQDGDEECR